MARVFLGVGVGLFHFKLLSGIHLLVTSGDQYLGGTMFKIIDRVCTYIFRFILNPSSSAITRVTYKVEANHLPRILILVINSEEPD
jgi:hypothetical protein